MSTSTHVLAFQSMYPRGVRRIRQRTDKQIWNFNPRTREGCDSKTQQSFRVSLHKTYIV